MIRADASAEWFVHRNLCVGFRQSKSLLWLGTTKGTMCAWITRDEITDLFDPSVRRQKNQGCSVSKLVSRWKTDQCWDWGGVKEYLLQYCIDKTFLIGCKIWLLFEATIAYWILSRLGSDGATIRNSWLRLKGKQMTYQRRQLPLLWWLIASVLLDATWGRCNLVSTYLTNSTDWKRAILVDLYVYVTLGLHIVQYPETNAWRF